ncbi:MAG: tetratricopeptide repeat protein [Raineya sp.]|jgi:tetratricopeptide (TPR) repeat protein|nr:tetratricopeptide repeat protein [Raineya sp.]
MDKQVLTGLLENPQNLTEDHLEELEEIVQKYPYFHLPHVLVARLLQEKNSSLALQKIRKASLYVYNRALLKKFVLNGAPMQPVNAMEEHNTQEPIHKKLFEDIQQEIDAFDKKIENASIEELDKELANITESYLPKDYISEEANKITDETPADKTETQKEQDFLIDEFLKSDLFKKDKKATDETLQAEDIQNDVEETEDETQKNDIENIEKHDVSNQIQTSVVINEFTEEEALRLFNEGNTKESIEIYEKLKEISPDKAEYYQSQIDIFKMDFSAIELKEDDVLLQDFLETPAPKDETHDLKVESVEIEKEVIVEKVTEYIEKKEEELVEPLEKNTEEKSLEEVETEKEVTEQQALAYFNEGKISEAVEIYKQLMLQNPDKKAYFASQIEILES